MPYSQPYKATFPWYRRQFNSTRLAGVEWEYNVCDNPSLNAWCKKWRGQRHSEHTGGEAITAPMAGDHIAKCLQDLGSAFQSTNRATVGSDCAIHVHVDGCSCRECLVSVGW